LLCEVLSIRYDLGRMLNYVDLTHLARARLKDAKVLLDKERYDAAAYLCGYAVEVALKARIVKTLNWSGFPELGHEFAGYSSFKTHDLDVLLHLSGWEQRIKTKFFAQWSSVNEWSPESRYKAPGNLTAAKADAMIFSAGIIVGALI
jgi:hypothetical protein